MGVRRRLTSAGRRARSGSKPKSAGDVARDDSACAQNAVMAKLHVSNFTWTLK
jgi:hypothetical protein